MWTVGEEPPDGADAVALLRAYFAELTERYFDRSTTEAEVDETLAEFPSTGLAAFFVLRADGEPAGCLGLHASGELTRVYVTPRLRGGGGARALLGAAEDRARTLGLTRLFLDTRADLVEARAFYLACGFVEIPPPTDTPGRFQDHWYEKPLVTPSTAEAPIAWDVDHETARDLAARDPRFEPDLVEASVRAVAAAWLAALGGDPAALEGLSAPGVADAVVHPAGGGRRRLAGAAVERIRIVDLDEDLSLGRMLLYLDARAGHSAVDPDGAFTEFLTLDPHGAPERPWRLIDAVGRMRSVQRGWEFVARRETPAELRARRDAGAAARPPSTTRWLRLVGTRPNGAPPDAVVVERDTAPSPWRVERLLLAAEDPQFAASLGASYFEPRYERIELVELLEPPPPRAQDRARLGDGLRRALRHPWQLPSARRLALGPFLERYARERRLRVHPVAGAPRGTWLLDSLTAAGPNAVLEGPLGPDTYGALLVLDAWTVAVVPLPSSHYPIADLVCGPPGEVPAELTEIRVGDPRVDDRYVVAVGLPSRADAVRSYFDEAFAAWLAELPRGALRFEIRGQTISVATKGRLDTSEALDAHCRATARFARHFG